jgi:hypothetical protein
MTRADLLRGIAQRCFELARQHHGFAADNLRTLGQEYDAKAAKLESQAASETVAAAGHPLADGRGAPSMAPMGDLVNRN